ncbi:hypothetical protein CPB86DRAFT_699557, partial [Serendipita vermifera]
MTNLLTLTTVSRRWCEVLTQTPTLWTTIHAKYADEDSIVAISTFLHLSGNAQLSLTVWGPLSRGWYSIFPLLLDHKDRIREVIL